MAERKFYSPLYSFSLVEKPNLGIVEQGAANFSPSNYLKDSKNEGGNFFSFVHLIEIGR